jgi:hypothetical protein
MKISAIPLRDCPDRKGYSARVDSDGLKWLEAHGKDYPSRIHAILRREMLASLRSASATEHRSLCRHHFIGPHHLVVFVLEDVAMPDVAAGKALEGHQNARDHAGIGADRVFPA